MAMTAAVKDELSRLSVTQVSCRKAEVSALLRFAGGLHIVAGRVVVEAEVDLGNVGEVTEVRPESIQDLLDAGRIISSGDVRVLIVNAQTGGAETDEVISKAKAAGIPVLEFTELVPEGDTYLTWMAQNISDLAGTLTR